MDIPPAANARPLSPEAELARLAHDPRPCEVVYNDPVTGKPFLRIFPSGKVHCDDPRGAMRRLGGYDLSPILRTALNAVLLAAERAGAARPAPAVAQPYMLDDPRVQRLRQGGARVTCYLSGDRMDRYAVYRAGGAAPLSECRSHAEARAEALRLAPDHPGHVLHVLQILETVALTVEHPAHEDEL